ncbi:MAG: hypothetical protein ACMUIE_09940 [Thermoplasmatota archaeon]
MEYLSTTNLMIALVFAGSILIIGIIVFAVIYLVRTFGGFKPQKGYDEEEYLVPVPGYDDR